MRSTTIVQDTTALFSTYHPVQEKIFLLFNSLKLQPNLNDKDEFRVHYLVLSVIVSLLTALQLISSALSIESFFHCYQKSYFHCVIHAVAYPIDMLGVKVNPFVSLGVTLFIFLFLAASALYLVKRKQMSAKSINNHAKSNLTFIFLFFVSYIGMDLMQFWSGVLVCNADVNVPLYGFELHRKLYGCGDSKRSGFMFLAVFSICAVVTFEFLMAKLSVSPDVRIHSITKRWSEKADVLMVSLKCLLVIQHTLIMHYNATSVLAVVVRALVTLWAFVTFVVQLMTSAMCTPIENRIRCAVSGSVLGACITGFAAEVMGNGYEMPPMYHVIAFCSLGAIGCLMAPWKLNAFTEEAKLALNACTENYNPQYLTDLMELVWEDGLTTTASASNLQNSAIEPQLQNQDLNSKALQNMNGTGQSEADNTFEAPRTSFAALKSFDEHEEDDGDDQNITNSAEDLLVEDTEVQREEATLVVDDPSRLTESRRRLEIYMDSSNFASLRSHMVFAADVVLFLRDFYTEWQNFSDTQKELAKVAMCQTLVALMRQPTVPSVTYVWFATFCLHILNDVPSCLKAIRMAVEKTQSWTTLYMCYSLQKTAESMRSVEDIEKSRKSGVNDLAAYRRRLLEAHAAHEYALDKNRRLFRTLLMDSSTSLDRGAHTDHTDLSRTALQAVLDAESLYSALAKDFPASEEVDVLTKSFKMQFFKQEYLAQSNEIQTIGNNTNNGDVSTIVVETSKVQRIRELEKVFHKNVNKIRIPLYVGVSVAFVLAIASLFVFTESFHNFPSYFQNFINISSLFVTVSHVCALTNRAVVGSSYTYEQKIAPYLPSLKALKDHLEVLGDAAIPDGMSIFNNALNTMTLNSPHINTIMLGYVGYPLAHVMMKMEGTVAAFDNYADLDKTERTQLNDLYYYLLEQMEADNMNDDYWTVRYMENIDMTAFTGGFESYLVVVLPIVYASNPGEVPSVKAILSYALLPSDNEAVVLTMSSQIDKLLGTLNEDKSDIMDLIVEKGMTEAFKFFNDMGFQYNSYLPDLSVTQLETTYIRSITMFEMSLKSLMKKLINFDFGNLKLDPEVHDTFHYCFNSSVLSNDAEKLIQVTINYMKSRLQDLRNSLIAIVVVALVSAFVCILVAFGFSTNLKQFDRPDGVSASSTALTKLSRNDRRKLYKCFIQLRTNRGIVDPDHQSSASVDLHQAVVNRMGHADDDFSGSEGAATVDDVDQDQENLPYISKKLDDDDDLAMQSASPTMRVRIDVETYAINDDRTHLTSQNAATLPDLTWKDEVRGFHRRALMVSAIGIYLAFAACAALMFGYQWTDADRVTPLFSELERVFHANFGYLDVAKDLPWIRNYGNPNWFPRIYANTNTTATEGMVTVRKEQLASSEFQYMMVEGRNGELLGQRFGARAKMLNEAGQCFSAKYNCTEVGGVYPGAKYLHPFGIMNSNMQLNMINMQFFTFMEIGKGIPFSADHKYAWIMVTANEHDFIDAFQLFYKTYYDEVSLYVTEGSSRQYMLFGISIAVFISMVIVGELTFWLREKQLNQLVVLFRMLPERILQDCAMLEEFGVVEDQDTFDHINK